MTKTNKEKKCDCDDDNSYSFFDPFGFGSLVDSHIEVDISEEDLAKRCAGAIDLAKKTGGIIPGGLEGELGELVKPKIKCSDVIRQIISKKREGYGRNDFTFPKVRPLAAGIFVPRKKEVSLKILAAYDCSGSMLFDSQIPFGISQLQVLDTKGEIYLVPFDTTPYFESMVKIRKADVNNLKKSKIKGLGGTAVSGVFNTYEKFCGKVDLIVIITDAYLSDCELNDIKMPAKSTDVVWLITGNNKSFKPKIGRVVLINK